MMHKRLTPWLRATGLSGRPAARKNDSAAVRGILIAMLLLPAGAAYPAIAEAVAPSGQAIVSREAREEAIRSIPFQELDGAARQKLAQVVSKPTIYRRLPTRVIDCDPDMYLFLVRHPEVVVSIWDLMGVTNVQVQRTGPFTLRATDGAGTTTDIELVYGSRDRHVVFAEGYYEGPLLAKRMTGRCVLVLTSDYQANGEKGVRVSSQLDVFLQLDNTGADLLARTLHPLVGRTADHNFFESAGFVAQLCQATERNAPGMQRLASRLAQVEPAVRVQFAQVAGVVGERAVMRQEMMTLPANTPMANGIAVADAPAPASLPIESLEAGAQAATGQAITNRAITNRGPGLAEPGTAGPVPLRHDGPNLRR